MNATIQEVEDAFNALGNLKEKTPKLSIPLEWVEAQENVRNKIESFRAAFATLLDYKQVLDPLIAAEKKTQDGKKRSFRCKVEKVTDRLQSQQVPVALVAVAANLIAQDAEGTPLDTVHAVEFVAPADNGDLWAAFSFPRLAKT